MIKRGRACLAVDLRMFVSLAVIQEMLAQVEMVEAGLARP